jgi:hypothetical protein
MTLKPPQHDIDLAIAQLAAQKTPSEHGHCITHHLDRSKLRMLRVIPLSGQFGITRHGDNTFSRSPSSLKNRICSEPTHSGFHATSTLVIHLSPSTR